ncbi:MAG TPA: GIY-YIG nuclease family protein [Candidatus Wallbacteria bacterium]|nr:GIY-YIG nuclease family protein [Candidatus Wallbacteria bacterium]
MENNDCGIYHAVFQLKKDRVIKVGAQGAMLFPAAFYVYTGTAQKNLSARVRRHAAREKKVRWHIDYLTVDPHVKFIAAYYKPFAKAGRECVMNLGIVINAAFYLPKFGTSDCVGCPSHLAAFEKLESAEFLFKGLLKVPVEGV